MATATLQAWAKKRICANRKGEKNLAPDKTTNLKFMLLVSFDTSSLSLQRTQYIRGNYYVYMHISDQLVIDFCKIEPT